MTQAFRWGWTRGCVAAAAGCVVGPLEDAVIVAPDEATEQAIRVQVQWFLDDVAPHPVYVNRIVVEDAADAPWAGRWTRSTGTIRLDLSVTGNARVNALRHELCHALDEQAVDFWRGAPGAYRAIADRPDFLGTARCLADERCRRREAFAQVCELGAWGTATLRRRCPGDPDALAESMAHLMDDVWLGSRPAVAGETGRRVGLPLGAPAWFAWAEGGSDPELARVSWRDAHGDHSRVAHLQSGASWDSDVDLGPGPRERPKPVFPKTDLDVLGTVAGTADGSAVVDVEINTDAFGAVRRRLWTEGSEYAVLEDGCGSTRNDLFTGLGDVMRLTVSDDAQELQWRRIGWVDP